MLEKPDKLLGRVRFREAKPDLTCNLIHETGVVWRRCGDLRTRRQYQVVDQTGAVAVRHGPDFMFAIGVEGRIDQFGGLFAAHVNNRLLIKMTDVQFAPFAGDRQSDHQGCHHAIRLLRVPVRRKETVPFVDQEFVEFRPDCFRRKAESLGCVVKDVA